MKFYRFVIKLIKHPVRFILRLKIEDLRQDKTVGKNVIICANHISNWDPAITVVATEMPINFMAKESLFKVPLLSNIIRLFGAFPVKRGRADASAIKKSIEIINNGGCFSLFPQGRRMMYVTPSPDQAQKGVGFICAKSRASVLPVGIYTKDYKIKPFRKITVRIGDVIPYERLDFGSEGDDYLLASQKLFSKICELAKPDKDE